MSSTQDDRDSKIGSPQLVDDTMAVDLPVKPISFVSLGSVVLDTLRFPSRPTLIDIPGGSATYSTLGARLTTTAADAPSTIGMVVLAGKDFPSAVLEIFKSWDIHLHVRYMPAGVKSARILLEYEDEVFGQKKHTLLAPKLQPLPSDLPPAHLLSSSFHFLATPSELESSIEDLLTRRAAAISSTNSQLPHDPLLVWEPAPLSCVATERSAHHLASKLVDIFSPNHIELAQICGGDGKRPFSKTLIEADAAEFLEASRTVDLLRGAMILVRAGEYGCYVLADGWSLCDGSAERTEPAEVAIIGRWFPAYHQHRDQLGDSSSLQSLQAKVVDATGAGNCFLGALAKTWSAKGTTLEEAVIQASVAASFAVEQVGLPTLTKSEEGIELWNGSAFEARVEEYREKLRREN